MNAEITNTKEFPYQYRCLQFGSEKRLLFLAGGIDPITGPRSAFHATATCVDFGGSVIWEDDRPRDKPYSKLLIGNSTLLLVIQDNFSRRPTGIFVLDSTTGQLRSTEELRVEDAVAFGQDIALVAEAYQGNAALHLFRFDDFSEVNKVALKSFQHGSERAIWRLASSQWDRKTSEGSTRFCVTFRCGDGRASSFEHEFRASLDGGPYYVASDSDRPDCVMLGEVGVLMRIGTARTSLRVVGDSNRSVDRVSAFTENGGLYSAIPYSQDQLICSFQSGAIGVFDVHDGTLQIVAEINNNPDWRALAVSNQNGLLAVLDTYNHRRPMSRLTLINLSI